MNSALKAGDKPRLGALRLAVAEIKRKQIDVGEVLTDDGVVAVLEKMIKQSRDALQQFEAAGREEQARKEAAEIAVLESYLPAKLDEAELEALIADAIRSTGAASVKDMGRVMAEIKARAGARADMAAAGAMVRNALSRS